MQSVADRWYIVFKRISLGVGILFAAAIIATLVTPGLETTRQSFGFNGVVLAITIIQLIYTVGFSKLVSNRFGIGPATMLIVLINSLIVLALMQATGGLVTWYALLWLLLVLISGMFGTYALVAGAFIIIAFFVISLTTLLSQNEPLDIRAFILPIGTMVAALLSHQIWKHAYVNQETKRVAQLSGMLKNKQQQAEVLIASLADGIIVTTTDGKISLINPLASRMTGWTAEEATGIDVHLVLKLQTKDGKELPEESDPFLVAANSKKPLDTTVRVVGKDKKETVVSIVASPVLNNSNLEGVVAVLRDISAGFKEQEQRAEFISTASHEMRTPVAAIEGYLALALNERVSKIDPKARSFLEKAHESTQHLGQLFQDLLTSAKAEDGRLVSHPEVIEMGSYLEQVSDALHFAANKKGLLSDFVFGTSNSENSSGSQGEHVVKPLYYVYADPDRLREVITNLFDNAVKYTPQGRVSVGLTGNAEVVQIFVRDTGNGIPKEDIPHLFQKFYRVDNTSTRTIGGTGLGLFICRKIIELYHGRIWVESEQGKGSTFYINLPRLTPEKAAKLQQQNTQGFDAIPSAIIDPSG